MFFVLFFFGIIFFIKDINFNFLLVFDSSRPSTVYNYYLDAVFMKFWFVILSVSKIKITEKEHTLNKNKCPKFDKS